MLRMGCLLPSLIRFAVDPLRSDMSCFSLLVEWCQSSGAGDNFSVLVSRQWALSAKWSVKSGPVDVFGYGRVVTCPALWRRRTEVFIGGR